MNPYDVAFLTLCVLVTASLYLAMTTIETFVDPGGLGNLTSGKHSVAWLRIRSRVPWWHHSWYVHGGERLPLVMATMTRMYKEAEHPLPDDADLFIAVTDHPLEANYGAPILAFCNTRPGIPNVITVPDCYTEGWPDAKIGSIFDIHAATSDAPAFRDRADKAFWMGNLRTHPVRAAMAEKFKGSNDVNIVSMEWTSEGPKPFVHLHDHCAYKYLIDMPGVGWSGRLQHLLCLGSVILLFDRDFHEYYMAYFKPGVHYIPIKKDGSDLLEKLEYLRGNPEYSASVASACYELTRDVFSKKRVDEYYSRVIRDYARVIGKTATIRPG